jgi:4-amino-4-deoxy-L-arabinose transferase-like glycosyltransferase
MQNGERQETVATTNRTGTDLLDRNRCLGLALLASASISLFLLWNYHCISVDGVRYIEAAKNFYAGHLEAGLSSVYPPGYPLLIALFYNFLHDWERAGQMISLISRLLLLLPLYGLLRAMYDRSVAALGCLLAAVSPFLAMYSVHVRTESLFFFLAVLALYILHRGMERHGTMDFFAGGLVSGFAYLVRPEALGFVVIVPAALALQRWTKDRWDWASIGGASAVLALGFALFATPYVVYLGSDTGQWGTVSRKAGVTLRVSLEQAGLLNAAIAEEFPAGESMSLPAFIKTHPWVYTNKVLYDFARSVPAYAEALHYSYVPFLLLGLAAVFRADLRRRKDILLLVYLFFFTLGFAAIYANRRYSVQLVPISMGWTAAGILWSWDWVRKRWSENSARIALMIVGAAFFVVTLPKTLKPVAKEKAHFKETGWYVRQRHGPGPLSMIVFDDRIAYYADAQAIFFGNFKLESDLAGELRRRSADFLIAEPRKLQRNYPRIFQSPESYGLRFEKEFVGPRRDRLVVYKLM